MCNLSLFDQFQGILKPAYNTIDMLEVELLDDDSEPRAWSDQLLKVSMSISPIIFFLLKRMILT